MSPFPTTFSEAKELVNSWSPLGLWSNDATGDAAVLGHIATPGPSSRLPIQTIRAPGSSSPTTEITSAAAERARNSPALSTGASHRNVKILVAAQAQSEQRSDVLEKHGARLPRHSFDSRRLSVTSGGTGRFSDGLARKKGILETYIIVKPPAATAKHPLNLQIQLVVRQSRPLAVSQDSDHSHPDLASENEASRAPTPSSVRSEEPGAVPMGRSLSDAIINGQDTTGPRDAFTRQRRAGSIKSTLSSDTNASSQLGVSRKRVEPMFNLTVHNVMQPTLVTDAATDAKVAKFLKRSIEILGLGSLEPTEFWMPQKDPSEQHPHSAMPTFASAPPSQPQVPSAATANSSPWPSESTRSTENLRPGPPTERSSKRHSLDISTLRVEKGSQEGTTRKLLGRLFKKRPGTASTQSSPFSGGQATAGSSGSLHGKLSRHSSRASHANNPVPATCVLPPGIDDSSHVDGTRQSTNVGHATFGTSPLIACSANPTIEITYDGAIGGLAAIPIPVKEHHRPTTSAPLSHITASYPFPLIPSSRALGYSWAIHKWAKKKTDMWTAQLSDASPVSRPWEEDAVEIVFEWIKVRLAPDGLPAEISKQLLLAGAKPTIVNTARIGPPPQSIPMRQPSLSTTGATVHDDENGSTAHSHGNDTDSQTSHSISRATAAEESESVSDHTYDSGAETDPEDSETPWTCSLWIRRTGERIPLATLTPAPHHPKVIGILKIPVGLRPVSLGFENALERGPGSDGGAGYIGLSEENLKDVICVTAMWLVAREEFGGIGRKRRV